MLNRRALLASTALVAVAPNVPSPVTATKIEDVRWSDGGHEDAIRRHVTDIRKPWKRAAVAE